jgi:hypothetical protein
MMMMMMMMIMMTVLWRSMFTTTKLTATSVAVVVVVAVVADYMAVLAFTPKHPPFVPMSLITQHPVHPKTSAISPTTSSIITTNPYLRMVTYNNINNGDGDYPSRRSDDRNTKIKHAVDNYVTKLAETFNLQKEDVEEITAALVDMLNDNEFWNPGKEAQRSEIKYVTKARLLDCLNDWVSTDDISRALDSLMQDLRVVRAVSPDTRMVPVDYHIADTVLKNDFDLHKFVEKIQSVAEEWNKTKDLKDPEKKYIAPYFCFIQSSGMGKTKLLHEFAKLTKTTSSHAHEDNSNLSEEFSCDFILSGDLLLEEEIPNNDVFHLELDLEEFVRDPHRDAYTVATDIQHHLERLLVTHRFHLGPMKKTHVFLFDDAQVLLDTHYQIEAFLFRCIRTWLRLKRRGCPTLIAVFSGTSSAILKYTDWKKDYMLEEMPEERSSRDAFVEPMSYSKGSRFFEPFITLTTMAMLESTAEVPRQSEYERSLRYGRPLFAKMHEKKELEPKLETILRRLLLDTWKDGFDWSKEMESWLSVLATRVQMGSTNKDVASQMVDKGFAYFTELTHNCATCVYMPDPVLARLAMCMMDEDWSLGSWQGKSKKWWSEAVMTLYTTGLCQPEDDNLGEVLTALYFLFCCDECRRNIEDNTNYTRFSVPLGDWITSLIGGSSSSESAGERNLKAPEIRINFIQVCRDYIQSPWSGVLDQVYLQRLYDAGTSFYTYPGCEIIDFVAPTIINAGSSNPTYSAVMVSMKSRVNFSSSDATNLCDKMKRKADMLKLKSVLCIVCLFGQTSVSDDGEYAYDTSMLSKLEEGENVATLLCIPRDDRFGLTDIFVDMTRASEQEELWLSHSFLRARGQSLKAEDFFGRDVDEENPSEAEMDFHELVNDLKKE